MIEAERTRIAADSRLGRLTAFVLFATLALGLAVPHAVDTGVAALTLMALGWLAVDSHARRPGLYRLEWLLILAVVAYVVGWLTAWILHGMSPAGISTAERILKLIGVVPLFLYLRRVDGLEAAWWNGLVAGAFVAGGYALWFFFSGQTGEWGSRVPGATHPIYFGGFALAFALMLIPRLADERQSSTARSLAAAAIVLAFVANALSGTRGAWLALPVLLGVYLFTAGARQPLRWRIGAPCAVLALSVVILMAPVLPMNDRLDTTLHEISQISIGEMTQGGLGQRVQLWQIAGQLVGLEPLTGTGPGSFELAVAESVQAGEYDTVLLEYEHPHSQYLSALIDGGVGLLALLVLLLASPVLLVSHLSRKHSRQCRYLAWCALAASITVAAMAASESIFQRNVGVTWFIFLSAAPAALSTARRPPRQHS